MDRIKKENWPATKNCERAIHELKPHPRNARVHSPEQIKVIEGLIQKHGWTNRVLIDEKNRIIAGHGRVEAAANLGITEIPCALAEGWSEEDILAYMIADNQSTIASEWDTERLVDQLQELGGGGVNLEGLGFSTADLDDLLGQEKEPRAPSVPLTERFGVVPFSVLNAREGWWQDRKRAWLAIGIRSEVGRGDNLLNMSDSVRLNGKAYQERFQKSSTRKAKKKATSSAKRTKKSAAAKKSSTQEAANDAKG